MRPGCWVSSPVPEAVSGSVILVALWRRLVGVSKAPSPVALRFAAEAFYWTFLIVPAHSLRVSWLAAKLQFSTSHVAFSLALGFDRDRMMNG